MKSSNKRRGPDFVKYFGPVLDAIKANDASARPKEVYDWIIENLSVGDDELSKLNKNGQSNFENKVAFARFYLVKAGYIDGGTRGVWALTEKGRTEQVDRKRALEIFDEVHAQWNARTTSGDLKEDTEVAPDDDSVISFDQSYTQEFLNLDDAQNQISSALLAMSAKGFEEFCARVLRTLGFENARTSGGSGDGGIDGFGEFLVNRFMRTKIAFQCKKYGVSSFVTPDKIRDFRGAVSGRVERGIFITTSGFTKGAAEEARRENAMPIELVDLSRLIEIVISENIGVQERKSLKVDLHFFRQYFDKEKA